MIRRMGKEGRRTKRDRKGHAINQTQNYVAQRRSCIVRGNDSEAKGEKEIHTDTDREYTETGTVIVIWELSECLCSSCAEMIFQTRLTDSLSHSDFPSRSRSSMAGSH
jgi:hypothetical protein